MLVILVLGDHFVHYEHKRFNDRGGNLQRIYGSIQECKDKCLEKSNDRDPCTGFEAYRHRGDKNTCYLKSAAKECLDSTKKVDLYVVSGNENFQCTILPMNL